MQTIIIYALVFLILMAIFPGLYSVRQGNAAVITMFGKYKRVGYPGLNFKIPFFEQIFKRISIQNRAVELDFVAITQDQANVNFKSMLLFSVINSEAETIKKVAFKFIDDKSFMQALVRSVEGSIRSYVATQKQSAILSLREEITYVVKNNLDETLDDWGFHLIDLQITDMVFDSEIMSSMAKVVASNNLKAAAENEGQALLITRTKAAEADGNYIKISAQAEKEASKLRGQGVALFREEMAKGMALAAKEMESADLGASMVLFSMWIDAIRYFAQEGKGNIMFLDGSPEGMEKTMKNLQAMLAEGFMKDK